jgi:hypothetical protein
MVACALLVLAGVSSASADAQTATSQQLKRDVLINADMWEPEPRMMAGGLGFTGIIGVPGISTNDLEGSERRVREAGGTWNTIDCPSGREPALAAYTSAVPPIGVAQAWGFPTTFSDGLPVEFSWPIRPSTLDPTDFEITLNTGRKVTPEVAAISPNLEYNERSVAVLFGKFGNRIPSNEPGSEFPVRTEVVAGETPLQLVGREGPVSAVGLAATTSTSPYDETDVPEERTGPRLTAAKLSVMSDAGEGAPPAFRGALPNDGISLYGDRADFRLRVYTTGGFKPDGVRAVFPTDFERFFRLHVTDRNGNQRLLTETGRRYRIDGHDLEILGLADLGPRQDSYDDCYREDGDNQIDIVLSGSREAVRRITDVEVPASDRYSPFHNPGGPGNDPTPGVRYSAPSPAHVQPVRLALNDPETVTTRPSKLRLRLRARSVQRSLRRIIARAACRRSDCNATVRGRIRVNPPGRSIRAFAIPSRQMHLAAGPWQRFTVALPPRARQAVRRTLRAGGTAHARLRMRAVHLLGDVARVRVQRAAIR